MTRPAVGHAPHPLLALLLAAADGRFPAVDGRAVLTRELANGLEAVVSFTGHAVVATALGAPDLDDLELDGYGRALRPRVLERLAGADGEVGVVDATLVARGRGGGRLRRRHDLDDHPRVRHAASLRGDVRAYGDERGLVTLAEGLAGRTELSVEVPADAPPGTGRALLGDALAVAAAGVPVFAAVSPGNARSLRAFLAAGFGVLGSEVIVRPGPSRASLRA